MKIESIEIEKLIPYPNNPRINDDAVEYVANSIKEFGFKNPIIIDKNNVIIAGHTRLKASKLLGMTKVPCIRADDLTEEQVKAFRLADNKVSEFSSWDYDKLEIELDDIQIDMGSFGIEIDVESAEIDPFPENDEGYYGDERQRTNRAYHLDLLSYVDLTNDFWQMPIIQNDHFIPKEMIGFNYAKNSERKDLTVHFFIDDYQFERVWNYPEKYVDILKDYDCILSPDFSLYLDMPMPMKIWNIYRSRQIGAYYQSKGIKVIPTLSWAEEETFSFCFQGIPQESIVAISTVGVKEDKNALDIWHKGMEEMINQVNPSMIINYGGKLDFNFKGIKVIYFDNKVTEDWRKRYNK